MYIGEVAKITGLTIKAIRLYEERGLIMAPPRSGRYRIYNQVHIDLLTLIKEAKALGASLGQLKEVIVYHNGEVDWPRIVTFLKQLKEQLIMQRDAINNKIANVNACIATIESEPL